MTHGETAILLFALKPATEARRKALLKGKGYKHNLELQRKLYRNIQHSLLQSPYPVLHCDDSKQVGTGFAERFCNAIEEVFQQGFENVIILGSDTPGLQSCHILESGVRLESGTATLSPTHSGGACLIAITRSHYQRSRFLAIRWQSRNTLQDLQDLLNAEIRESFLDLNTSNDALRFAISSHKHFIACWLKQLLLQPEQALMEQLLIRNPFITFNLSFRGPPVLV